LKSAALVRSALPVLIWAVFYFGMRPITTQFGFGHMPHPNLFWFALGALGAGVFFLVWAGLDDRRNWVVEKATPMSVSLLNPRDDVWIYGQVQCAAPLVVPNFEIPCIYFTYEEHELVRSVPGNAYWRLVYQADNQVDFEIVQGSSRIGVTAVQARFDGLYHCADPADSALRRSATYFPYPAFVSAVGSVAEDRKHLEKYGNIPLIVSRRTREEYITSIERRETWLRYAGGFLFFLGLFGVLFNLSLNCDVPPVYEGETPWANVWASLGGALAVLLIWFTGFLYNSLVHLRERVKTAWRQIDVDLKNRYDLIPELVTTIKAYSQHERELQELIARLNVGADREASVPLAEVWAIAERYPALQANELFKQLQNQLTALEEKIAFGRQFYNDSLLHYNNARLRLPASIVAHLFRRFPVYEPFSGAE
jgi:LemA protein